MRKLLACAFASSVLLVCQGCTEPGETTAIGAATGGVLGAGLGAIVGNQTGDPGTGLVIGGLAGAGAGAAVGNALEAQDQRMRSQDEVLTRQEKTIQAQNAEINELRSMSSEDTRGRYAASSAKGRTDQSNVSSRDLIAPKSGARPYGESASSDRRAAAPSFGHEETREEVAAIGISSGGVSSGGTAARMSNTVQQTGQQVERQPAQQGAASLNSAGSSVECQVAQQEHSKAARLSDNADRLFHIRRALRLCPNNADFHNSLGEVYLALNRQSDAEFEFKEALKLEPGHTAASGNLKLMHSAAR